jgi:putative endonuclease
MARKACEYYVYLLSSRSGTLYVGVTNDLVRRVWQHKQGTSDGFTKRYGINRLVWFESGGDVIGAIEREKQIKAWRREKKVALIVAGNPAWDDLSVGWFDTTPE